MTKSSNASGSTSPTIRATCPPWQYVRRIAFMSTSATRHQNFRFEFETVKNARADSPPARTLLPPVSASPSPGGPTRSLPPPAVDSHAPAAFLDDFARAPRALHVASSPCQEVTASTATRRARPRETVASAQFARGNRVQRLCENFDGRWTCEGRARHARSDKTAKVGPVGAHPLSRGTTRTLAGSVLE